MKRNHQSYGTESDDLMMWLYEPFLFTGLVVNLFCQRKKVSLTVEAIKAPDGDYGELVILKYYGKLNSCLHCYFGV